MKGAKAVQKKQKNLSLKTSRANPQLNNIPSLRFTPTAWAKLLFLRDFGPTEVGGFGICPNDPLLVEDIQLVRQVCTYTFVAFDDGSVADFFDEQVDLSLRPDQFARIWIHTHPGDSPTPSHTDEATFTRVFGKSDWAAMFILASGGDVYSRLRIGVSPQVEVLTDVAVDYESQFAGCDFEAWEQEYLQNVIPSDAFEVGHTLKKSQRQESSGSVLDWGDNFSRTEVLSAYDDYPYDDQWSKW
jgi:proteasome lid subunit RPN8/RPN11